MTRLFDSHADEIEALSTPGIVFNRPPRFTYGRENDQMAAIYELQVYEIGLRYLPNNRETNYLRCVRIENLPDGVKLQEVLAQICGGAVFSAQLLNTVPISGYHTALVVFVRQSAAETFTQYAKNNGIWFKGLRAVVAMVNTPTYPMPRKYEHLLSQGYSRCLVINHATPDLVDRLHSVLNDCRGCSDFIEHCEEDFETADGSIKIRFHAVKNSMVAYELLTKHPAFKHCRFSFAVDPCSRTPAPESTLAR